MTYPHQDCDNPSCDKPARVESRYCSVACLNEHALLKAAEYPIAEPDGEDWIIR